jgi:putative transposase
MQCGVQAGRPGKESVADVVKSLPGTSALAVARQGGGRQRYGNGATVRARGSVVSTVGGEAEHPRRSLRHQA